MSKLSVYCFAARVVKQSMDSSCCVLNRFVGLSIHRVKPSQCSFSPCRDLSASRQTLFHTRFPRSEYWRHDQPVDVTAVSAAEDLFSGTPHTKRLSVAERPNTYNSYLVSRAMVLPSLQSEQLGLLVVGVVCVVSPSLRLPRSLWRSA